MRDYTGTIVRESLKRPEVLNDLEIVGERLTNEVSPEQGWCIYTVRVSGDEIDRIVWELKEGPWYAHFWIKRRVLVVYRDQKFEIDYDDRSTWNSAIKHGNHLPQLDFKIP